jgi:hypothetical protein
MPPKQTLYLILDDTNDSLLAVRKSAEDAALFTNNTGALCAAYAVEAKPLLADVSAQEAFEKENAERSREPVTGDTLPMVEVERRLAVTED